MCAYDSIKQLLLLLLFMDGFELNSFAPLPPFLLPPLTFPFFFVCVSAVCVLLLVRVALLLPLPFAVYWFR
jgi:hypothetical protein